MRYLSSIYEMNNVKIFIEILKNNKTIYRFNKIKSNKNKN